MKLPIIFSTEFGPLNIRKICILRLSAIGDVCHAVAAVERIQRQQPDIEITWIIGKVEHALVGDLPGVTFVVFDKRKMSESIRHLKQTLAGQVFDALCLMQVSFRANRLARHVKARVKLGFDWARSKELHALFCNKRIAPQQHAHVLEGFMGFVDALGIDRCESVRWHIPIPKSDQKWAEQQADELGEFAVISPAASKAERNWLAEQYAEVANHLQHKGVNVVLCGGPGKLDKALGEAIIACGANISKNYIGQTSLKQMLALLQQAKLVIAPDTGPAHMATTVNTPVIGLYAHSNPLRTGPYNDLNHVVSVYDEAIKEQKGKPWQQLNWNTRAKGTELMARIHTSMVVEKIDQLLAQ